ncbi:MAG TPA: cytidylate kinase-like family protein [Pirellulales bacterium]|jgi:cytidylate kinase|nr:cytidylate kinase-like family protein [Pirellulales bacterium]
MNLSNTVRLPEAIVKAFSHGDAQHKDRGKRKSVVVPPLTITISRQAGAQGTTVARAVGGRLGWPVLDHELLERMAAEMHVNVRLLDSIDEQHVPWLVERMEAFSSIPFVSESSYVRQLLDTVLSLAARGECVIVGRGAAQILPPALAIRVRLVADFVDRARTMMRELSCTLEEAERHVKTLDHQRATFIRNHFHCDAAAPENYDLLLNTSRFDIDTCSQIIITALEDRRRTWANGAA